jgi:hypothetical protein
VGLELTRLLALVAAATVACTGGSRSNGASPPTGSAPAPVPVVASADAAAPIPVVTDQATAGDNLGKPVEVRGTAVNAKLAAAVKAGDIVVYCLGIDSWPTKLANTQVTARGTLEFTSELAADSAGGVVSAGTTGKVYVLRACEYEPQ